MTTTKTTADRLAELEAEYQAKRAEIIKDEQFLAALPAWAHEYKHGSPHWYKLYGREVSIHFEPLRYSSIEQGLKSPDLEFVARLMDEFPPLPLVMVKDGCTSVRPAAAAPEDSERVSLTPIAPFTIRIDTSELAASFEWTAAVGGFVAEFKVSLPLPAKLGRLDVRVKEDRYGGRKVERCEFEPTVAGARRIRWATGGPQYTNDFTVYWEAPAYTFAELVESLRR